MLCRPDADNVLETLIFLVARHMIVTDTTPVQDLVSTISILMLLVMKKIIQDPDCLRKTFPGRDREEKKAPSSSDSDKV
jgi:hypothetical protein